MGNDIDRAGVAKAYGRWAPIYDLVFGKVFDHGRQSTIAEADKIGGRILDVGVGTGLSLSDYSRTTKLCGVDISEPMLRKAQERVRALKLTNVETLAVMDAKNLAFADGFFDAVVAQYVITAVPDPEATLDDFIRVLKPGGELILVNHIGAESGPRRLFELAFAPLARRLGWRPEFPWARLVDWAAKHGGVTPDRTPPDAADGAFFADPLSQVLNVPEFPAEHPSRDVRCVLMRMKVTSLLVIACGPPYPAWRLRRRLQPQSRRPQKRRRPRHRLQVRLLAPHDTAAPKGETTGKLAEPLGDKLAKSDGVICPPSGVDPEIRARTPEGGNTPVIPPPGSPGGDPTVRPK